MPEHNIMRMRVTMMNTIMRAVSNNRHGMGAKQLDLKSDYLMNSNA